MLTNRSRESLSVRPLHDRIIVRRLEEGEQKIGGIIIPDTAKEKPQQGKVIAAGNGKMKDDGKRVPLDVKAGDLILFGNLYDRPQHLIPLCASQAPRGILAVAGGVVLVIAGVRRHA